MSLDGLDSDVRSRCKRVRLGSTSFNGESMWSFTSSLCSNGGWQTRRLVLTKARLMDPRSVVNLATVIFLIRPVFCRKNAICLFFHVLYAALSATRNDSLLCKSVVCNIYHVTKSPSSLFHPKVSGAIPKCLSIVPRVSCRHSSS